MKKRFKEDYVDVKNPTSDKLKDYRRTKSEKLKEGQSSYKTNGEFEWKLNDEDGKLNEVGVVFLLCLTMEKRFRGTFFEALKNRNSTVYDETFRRICDALAIYPPQPNIKTAQDDFEFGMDILGELRKCPLELFNVISPKNQEKFRIGDGEDGETYEVLLKRNPKNDKFEHLTLGYLERSDVFKDIGIFSYIGQYYSKCYDKKLIDGETEYRYIHKKAYAIGHLEGEKGIRQYLKDETLQLEKGEIKKLAKEPEPFEPYLSEVHPKYIVNGDKVGFSKLDLGKTQGKKFILPTLKQKINDKDSLSNPEPKVWLSRYELPALAFYVYLLEQLDEQKRKAFKSVKDILFEHQFQAKKPKSNEKTPIEKILHRIDLYINECHQKLRRIERDEAQKKINHGKKQKRNVLKDGEMASWLASDMMKLQPSKDKGKDKGKDKLTGANYRALQRSLAISDSGHWDRIFTSAKLIKDDIEHPFLKQFQKLQDYNIQTFYKAYLQKRKDYFEKLQNDFKKKQMKGKTNVNPSNLVQKKLFGKYCNSKETKNERLLPRGIFTEAIKDWFKEFGTDKMKNVADQDKTNVAYMVQQYFEELGDELPEVYDFGRGYGYFNSKGNDDKPKFPSYNERFVNNIIEALKNCKRPNALEKPFGEEDDSKEWQAYKKNFSIRNSYKSLKKNEDRIRMRGVQDRLLFLMSKKFLDDDITNKDEYKLKNIQDIFSQKADFEFKQNLKLEHIELDENDKPKKGDSDKFVTFKFEDVPLKNYGRIYRYKTDSRLPALSALLYKEGEKNVFSEADLSKEIMNYEKSRLAVLELAFEMEEKFFKNHPEELEKLGEIDENFEWNKEHEKKIEYFNFSKLLEKMKDNNQLTDEKIGCLFGIRNKFAHTDYVEKFYAKDYQKGKEFDLPEVAKFFKDIFKID